VPPTDGSLVVTARAYTHRLAGKKPPGLCLLTYPKPRRFPLADFKTLNYLYYLTAGRWARARGADEALILNPDGSASETDTTNLLVITGQQVVRPVSDHVLPGVMQQAACALLSSWGYGVVNRTQMPVDLTVADGVIATNSLMGAVPVVSLDGARMHPLIEVCDRINLQVFGREA
jgi:para-aminobenzoate synthetase component 1